jgi:hypothetical protein
MTNKSIRDYINLIENAQSEEVAEGWTKLPSGDYQNSHTGVRSSKPPVKKKRGEKTGAEWDAIEKAKKDKEQGVTEGEAGNYYSIALQMYPHLKQFDRATVITALNNAYEDYLMHYGYEGIGPDEERSMIDRAIKGLKQGVAEEQVEESTPDAVSKVESLFRDK